MMKGKGITLDARVVVNTVVVVEFDEPELVTHSRLAELAVVLDGHVLVQLPEYKKYPDSHPSTHLDVVESFW